MNKQLFNITTDWLGGWDAPATIEDIEEVLQPSEMFDYEVGVQGNELRVYASREADILDEVGPPVAPLNWQMINADEYYVVIGELVAEGSKQG